MLRYGDIPTHRTEVGDWTSLTVDEFAALVPPFEAAFWGDMATWTLHGRLFGRRPSKATQWLHVLRPVWRDTLRTLGEGDAPCRRVEALRARLEVEGPPSP
jgi:hypothetical protein